MAPEPRGVYVHTYRPRRGGNRAAKWGQGRRRPGGREGAGEAEDPRDNPGQGGVAAAGTGG